MGQEEDTMKRCKHPKVAKIPPEEPRDSMSQHQWCPDCGALRYQKITILEPVCWQPWMLPQTQLDIDRT